MRFTHLLLVAASACHGAAALCDPAICDAYKMAYMLEREQLTNPPAGVPAGPWCKVGAGIIPGVSAQDADKLKIEPCTLVPTEAGVHQFEHRHTTYKKLANGELDVTCYTYVEPLGNTKDNITLDNTKSIDCKMVDATRVAAELGIKTDPTVQCLEVNKKAIEVAKKMLPAATVQQYESHGRPFCLKDDEGVFMNIGPLWVGKPMKLVETDKCLEVTSTKLISTVHSPIFPGNHYCKLLSPARAMDWIVTNSLKPYNPCGGCSDMITV